MDLPYCGHIRQALTKVEARTKYFSDCYLTPYINEEDIKHYKYEIDLTLTCVAKNESEHLGKR